jgi:hypothetical protein
LRTYLAGLEAAGFRSLGVMSWGSRSRSRYIGRNFGAVRAELAELLGRHLLAVPSSRHTSQPSPKPGELPHGVKRGSRSECGEEPWLRRSSRERRQPIEGSQNDENEGKEESGAELVPEERLDGRP